MRRTGIAQRQSGMKRRKECGCGAGKTRKEQESKRKGAEKKVWKLN